MPSSIVVTLTARQQALMLAQWRQARYGHLLTLHTLLLLHHGYSPTQIAACLFCSRSSVYRSRTAWHRGSFRLTLVGLCAGRRTPATDAAPAVQNYELTAQHWFEKAYAATELDDKLRFYSESIRLQPSFAEAFNRRAGARFESGDKEGAIKDFNEAIQLEPNYRVFYNRGLAWFATGDNDRAISDFSEAVQLNPNFAQAFYMRGLVWRAKGDNDRGIKNLSEAIRLKPDFAHAFYNRGLARRSSGDHAGAIRDYSDAILLKPNLPDVADVFYARGNARLEQGDHVGAIRDYGDAIRLEPNYVAAFQNRSLARHAIGDLRGAFEDLQHASNITGKLKPSRHGFTL